ncbi:MAG: ABC transporter ATP-binding protein/permease [Rickettsiales bacterium]|nr:ABC transporter ATP-binding protein/permease [Rickettsiales bacterium]
MLSRPALPRRLAPFIWYFLSARKTSFFLLAALSLMWPVEQVLFPYVVKLMIDSFSSFQGERADIWQVLSGPLWFGGLLWLASVVTWRVVDAVDYYFTPLLQADIREKLTGYVFGHSHRYFSSHLTGSISNKIGDMVHGVHFMVTQGVRFYIPSVVCALFTAAIMASISPLFAAVLLGWTVAHLAICAYYSKLCDTVAFTHSELRSELMGRIVDSISNFITVRLFARQAEELAYIHRFQQQEIAAHRRMIFTIAKVKMLLEVPCFLMIVLLIRVLVARWQEGLVSSGDVAFILSTTINLMYLLWRVGMEFPTFYREIGVCQQALALVQEPHELLDREGAEPIRVTRGEIVFDGVTFQYHAGQNLFAGKNITIRAGEKVGLVGFSGSGKSTFVNLILRLYDLESGAIRIDGQDISLATQASLRAQIALIPQEPVLFHRSLRENIAYGRPEATEAEIVAAAKLAHCHDFIMQAEHGYDSLVGERGVKLSGGQRQRIAIARAILKNANILMLDEATSSLDSVTEAAIQESMRQLMAARTTVVIAHRLSTLLAMDRVLVFRGGVIIEDGAHAQLLAQGGHYAQLWRMQAGGFLPDAA